MIAELISELTADPLGTIPPFILMAFLFWSTLMVGKTDDERRGTKIATIFVLIALIQGLIGVFVEVTVGLPPMYNLTVVAYCLVSLPMIMQIRFFPIHEIATKEDEA